MLKRPGALPCEGYASGPHPPYLHLRRDAYLNLHFALSTTLRIIRTMNVSWSARDPYNATIIDDASGEAIFTLNSPFSLTKKAITLSDARSGQVIAEDRPQAAAQQPP